MSAQARIVKAPPTAVWEVLADGWLSSSGPDTEVTMKEDAVTGPAVLVPKPVRDVTLNRRNAEALHRLAYLAEGRPSRP